MLIYIVKHCYVLVFWLFRMLYRIIVQLGFFFPNHSHHPLWKMFAAQV